MRATTMVRRQPRRLGLRAALALAAVMAEQAQWALLSAEGAVDEWAPFGNVCPPDGDAGEDESEAAAAKPGSAQHDDAADERPAAGMLFSHFLTRDEDGVRRYTRSFSSVQDFCEQPFANKQNEELFNAEENGGKFRDWNTEDLRDDESMRNEQRTNEFWYGARSPAEAMRRAYKGWPEGAERVRKMMDNIDAPAPLSLRRKVQRADQGDELDVHSVYRGDLDHAWTRRRRQNTRSRMSVRLVAQCGGSRHMDAEEMFWRGAAVVKLAELLEESSYRVELVGTEWHEVETGWLASDEDKKRGATVINSFIVKDAGAPRDVEQVAGVLCNAGFFRTYGFRSAYAAAEHVWRGTYIEPQFKYVKRLGRTAKEPIINPKTGRQKAKRATLLARTTQGYGNIVEELGLADDGTLTFVVPTGIARRERAEAWVRACLAKLEGGTEEVDNDE